MSGEMSREMSRDLAHLGSYEVASPGAPSVSKALKGVRVTLQTGLKIRVSGVQFPPWPLWITNDASLMLSPRNTAPENQGPFSFSIPRVKDFVSVS